MRKFIFIPILLFLCGCTVKKQHHDLYGFAEDNKLIYNKHLSECKSFAYDRYPPRDFYIPNYNVQNYQNRSGIGNAISQGKAMADAENARNRAMNEQNNYSKARNEYIDTCMSNFGWIEIEVDL